MQSKLGALARGVAMGSILALALGCTNAPVGSGGRARPGAKSASARSAAARKPDLASIEREVLNRVNRYRRAEGLPALASDARIAEIARGHSRSMAAGRTGFGHGGFEGRTRALEGKLPYRRVAENVSRHVRDPRQIPAVAVDRWVDSRGHRRNIEGPFALTGVGAAAGPDGSVYLTQIFVLPR
jgi:uncharacterized protein YkwD